MIEQVFQSARVPRRLQRCPLGLRIFDAQTEYLVDKGYSAMKLLRCVQSIEHFDRWLRRSRRPVHHTREELVGEFLDHRDATPRTGRIPG